MEHAVAAAFEAKTYQGRTPAPAGASAPRQSAMASRLADLDSDPEDIEQPQVDCTMLARQAVKQY